MVIDCKEPGGTGYVEPVLEVADRPFEFAPVHDSRHKPAVLNAPMKDSPVTYPEPVPPRVISDRDHVDVLSLGF